MVPLSSTHEKLHPGSTTTRRVPRSLTCNVESLTAHILNVNLLRYDFARIRDYRAVTPSSSTHDKLHSGSATPRLLPRGLTCCVPSLTAPAAYQVSWLVKFVTATKISLSLFLHSPKPATGPLPRESLEPLRTTKDFDFSPKFLRHTRGSQCL